MNLEKYLTNFINATFYILVGLALIFFCDFITPYVTYISGALLIINAILVLIQYFLNKSYTIQGNTSIKSFVLNLALGVLFIVYHDLGLTLFALFWGLHAFLNAFECFHLTLYSVVNKQKWYLHLIEGSVELILGIMLFLEFSEGISTHFIILGSYLIFVGVFLCFGVNVKKKEKSNIKLEDLDYTE